MLYQELPNPNVLLEYLTALLDSVPRNIMQHKILEVENLVVDCCPKTFWQQKYWEIGLYKLHLKWWPWDVSKTRW